MFTRRNLLGSAALSALSLTTLGRSAQAHPASGALSEDFWRTVQEAFTLDRTMINLNNGGVSPSPRVVHEALKRYLDISNQAPAYYMWRVLEPNVEQVRVRLAKAAGCSPDELAVTRNASEALQIAQLGISLDRGDEVLTTDQDYGRMLDTWEQRVRRDGISLKKISFQVPASDDDLVARFEAAITRKTRVIHLCHITNLTGQILPVKRVCALARERGIVTIVDGAHAFAHFPFRIDELGCDYYGTSLHKWLLAPVGTGFLYVRKERIKDTWPLTPANASLDEDIRKFEEIGTHPAANHDAIAEALTFHEGIGVERKAARLRQLRDRWMDGVSALDDRVRLLTPRGDVLSCAIGTFGVDGVDPEAITHALWSKHRILTTPIAHPDVMGVRVTPNVYTTLGEIDTFVDVMQTVLRDV